MKVDHQAAVAFCMKSEFVQQLHNVHNVLIGDEITLDFVVSIKVFGDCTASSNIPLLIMSWFSSLIAFREPGVYRKPLE